MNPDLTIATSHVEEQDFQFVILLGVDLALAISETSLAGGFRCRGEVFNAPADYPCTGFYDCLRNSENEVVGTGYFPDDDLIFLGVSKIRLLDRLREADYAKLFDNLILFLLLDRNASLATAQPGGEQEFDECRLFTGDQGNFALSIRTTYLTQSDIDRFVASGTESVSIDVLTQNR